MTTSKTDTVSVVLPADSNKNVFINVQDKKEPRAHDSKVQSFRLPEMLDNSLFIKIHNIPMCNVYNILIKRGMSTTCPKRLGANGEFINFDWDPLDHGTNTKPLYFKWNNTLCSIIGRGRDRLFNFRVHTDDPDIANVIINEFYDECYKTYISPVVKNEFSVYTAQLSMHGIEWKHLTSKRSRDMSTIYIDENIKKNLITGLTNFYNSRDFYEKYGVTWKRVHLFHGSPGAGKTSMIVALASHFKRNIAKVTVTPNINSAVFEKLFCTVPMDSFLVLEDVDALFQDRDAKQGVDFSTMLNCMDGLSTARGLVVFMTTNYPNKLESAFIRPGRVDCSVEFNSVNKETFMTAIANLAPDFAHEHEQFYNLYGKDMSIAGLQHHVFQTIMLSEGLRPSLLTRDFAG